MSMQKLSWDQSYSVGVAELDSHHQELFKLLNHFLDLAGKDYKSEVVTEALTKMTQYACLHLDREEELLREHGYPNFAGHKEQHARYKAKTVELCMGLMAGKSDPPAEIGSFLRDWWNGHVLKNDMEYKSFLNEKGVR
ncbi:MAG: hypothetical protein A2X40_09235 [Elusimicrobia bacterium GWC2_65_9]|nr:MAG: hypothetical protein A2X40_09235 [Elusimicrobia bacterium GWC2_65_9]